MIDSRKYRDVAMRAYELCVRGEMSKKEAQIEIERGIGNVAAAAYKMCHFCDSSRFWAETQIMRKIGDTKSSADYMVIYCGSSIHWAEKCKECDFIDCGLGCGPNGTIGVLSCLSICNPLL